MERSTGILVPNVNLAGTEEDIRMDLTSAMTVFKESAMFFLRLLPYLLAGLFVGAILEVALSRHQEVHWLKRPGTLGYTMVSLLGVGTPL